MVEEISQRFSTKLEAKGTDSESLFFMIDGAKSSFFHDIPYKSAKSSTASSIYNMVVEIPRHSHAKMETSMKIENNPIVQDWKNGAKRFLKNVWPMHGCPFNYGAIPQTFESPNADHSFVDEFFPNADPELKKGLKGDKDPLDVLDIGKKIYNTGSIIQIKILGALAMVDDGELDFKIVSISNDDEMASKLNCIDDVNKNMPGLLKSIYSYWKFYKHPTVNRFLEGFNFLDSAKTCELIEKMHSFYKADFSSEFSKSKAKNCETLDFQRQELALESPNQIEFIYPSTE